MSDAISKYLEHYRATRLHGSPCSAEDIVQVERQARVQLPAAYKAYLLVAGHDPPAAWVGSDCTIDDLPKLYDWAQHMLAECHQPPLPKDAFVFIMHQGYQFFYFVADGLSDDPPVFYYLEYEPEIVRRFERLTDLLEIVARDSRDT
jgi:SMI1 / KNR4 family (SUKH-1)